MAALQLPVRRTYLGQGIDPCDRDFEDSLVHEGSQFGQYLGARTDRVPVGPDAVPLCGGEVDDGVDPLGRYPQVEREVDVPAAERVDERVDPASCAAPQPA